MPETPTTPFAVLWEQHHLTVRRLLVAWTRNIDLADDLLQETYLRAIAGFSGYRGGDVKAWLTAIARNVWYAHFRRQRPAESLDENTLPVNYCPIGSADHIAALVIRQAIDGLTPELQTALLLRHYGDLSYSQIAERCACPVGTARRRVWTAIRQLRRILDSERKERTMTCRTINELQLLEYLYGVMPAEQQTHLQAHLATCKEHREAERQYAKILASLNEVAGQYVTFYLIELDANGAPTIHTLGRITNISDQPMTEFHMFQSPGVHVTFAAFQGEELPVTSRPWEHDPSRLHETVQLPTPVAPGESFDGLVVAQTSNKDEHAIEVAPGQWRYTSNMGIGSLRDASLIVLAVRLPRGAELLHTTPLAASTVRNDLTTVVWRLLPPPQDPTDFVVEYRYRP